MLVPLVGLTLLGGQPEARSQSDSTYLAFTLEITGDPNTPKLTFVNESRGLQITNIVMTSGNGTNGFDYAYNLQPPPYGNISLISPNTVASDNIVFPVLALNVTGFDPGERLSLQVDIDAIGRNSAEDYRTTFFNNGSWPESVITVQGGGQTATLTLPAAPGTLSSYTFGVPRPTRILRVKSETESGLAVAKAKVITNDGEPPETTISGIYATNIGSEVTIELKDGDTVEISAPQLVYKDIFGTDITDSAQSDPQIIQSDAEERFTAIGISVNEEPQTGDPTLYRFDISQDTVVVVKWRHEYGLTITHDPTLTESQESDPVTLEPWAGPLDSNAAGNPDPEAKKHWIPAGEQLGATIDGQVLDFSRAGLDVRYVPMGYETYGPPNTGTSANDDEALRAAGTDIRTNQASVAFVPFTVRQAPTGRQAVNPFTMYGPGGIKYRWQIQFGVRVNADDLSRTGKPKIFQRLNNSWSEAFSGEGTFWFNPGTSLRVGSAVLDDSGKALSGWINGDGYYFSSSGEIDTTDGHLISGGPGVRPNGNPAGAWESEFVDSTGVKYRGVRIPDLQRAARVLWRYGDQQLRVQARIGEYVFQGNSLENSFTAQPTMITKVAVTGLNKNVGDTDMAIWDSAASRLYPLVPGIFKATWPVSPGSLSTVEVIVTATYPEPAHYPHIAQAPPVALDPDPNDSFVFKELRYTENDAAVDGNNLFTATTPGHAVLVFNEIQREGRSEPREFLAVRVVDTRRWDDQLPSSGTGVIGQKLTDSTLDRAALGTGFVMFEQARYNPFVYDVTKLEGLAARNVYDMTALRASKQKIVVHKDALPGPVIPVNLDPGAARTNRVVVVWYDDPTENDELLWPYRARVYFPRWPQDASEGLGRIVIASQFGSESVATNGQDQVVVPAVTNVYTTAGGGLVTNIIPAETTYNPSRLQQVQVYSQPDPLSAGYNPNEEHALLAPSLRYAQVSPRPPAVYALRDNDLNRYNRANATFLESLEDPGLFTSHPFVLVQFLDTVDNEFKMRVYTVVKEDANIPGYRFADPDYLTDSTPARTLQSEPHVVMETGEPVIPFYPLVEVIGASPCPQSFGTNLKDQSVYWEDHKGSSWAVSGGENAWFTVSTFYPLTPDFWWPTNQPGYISEEVENGVLVRRATVPQTGDCVSFLPARIDSLLGFAADATIPSLSNVGADVTPTRVLYKSDWPALAPVLKAGETLTFQGGEFRTDHPFDQVVEDGELKTVETPGLPGVVAFATAEVVFDSLNPQANVAQWATQWTARVAQVLDVRSVPMTLGEFPPDLAPATRRTRVSQGEYIFNELPASLQNRVRYDPLNGKLEFSGLLNNKDIAEPTLTAAPSAVYILEPNIMTAEDEAALANLSEKSTWRAAVADLARLSRNPALIDSDNPDLPDPADADYRSVLEQFWLDYYTDVGALTAGATVPLPIPIASVDNAYLVGLEPKVLRDSTDKVVTIEDPAVEGLQRVVKDPKQGVPMRAFGPGLALLPNAAFLDPLAGYPDVSWVVVAENNDPSLGGSPITLHVIKVDRSERYRGAIKTTLSDNVFDENLGLRHTGDFGANAGELYFEWWYRPDDGSLNVPPPDLVPAGQQNPWKLFPDPTGNRGRGRYQITLKGNPNAPEALLADTWWFVRYRHQNDPVQGTNWKVPQPDGAGHVNFTWAGAGNSDPFDDFDADGVPDYRAQLAQGWIKRVLDAVNPYEARIRDFEGDSPTTQVSMISQFGPRFEGPVALNPDKNVIENVGLIELYETILKRGRDLSIDLSRPVSTPAIANALQLAATRMSDFYVILGNEAYADAVDPTIGIGSDSVDPGNVAPVVFAFQNQVSSMIEEELALLRGVDDYFARPVYNRLFWNFTKGEGEAAYAMNYNITDLNMDGFIDENDAMLMFPQGHGDAWGHYLTALRNQYDLLRNEYFNWVSRSEFYNLQDIVIKVDFLDERKFAQTAAAKAKTGAEIVNLTYRNNYVEDATAQWQGYTDSLKDRSWGVQGWARRAGQGAYFDWITANALLPSQHPDQKLEGIQEVDRKANSDIAVVSANLNSIQRTFDQANDGENPLSLSRDVVPFDINPAKIEDMVYGLTYFEQIHERATQALDNAGAIWDNANEVQNLLRKVGNSESEFRNSVYQEDLSHRNELVKLFGKPYEGTIGPGKVYPAGYDGPDLLLYMYVDVREINDQTVPGPTTDFAKFDDSGALIDGDIYHAFEDGVGSGGAPRADLADIQHPFMPLYLNEDTRRLFAPTFTAPANGGDPAVTVRNGLYAVNYTDLMTPKVPLDNLSQLMPVTAAGYTFQAPRDWGRRGAVGELQLHINKMLQQEAQVASTIGEWDSLQGSVVRELRFINAKLDMQANLRLKKEIFNRLKYIIENVIKGIEGGIEIADTLGEVTELTFNASKEATPEFLPIGGLAISPGDAMFALDAGLEISKTVTKTTIRSGKTVLKIAKLASEIGLDVSEKELELFEGREEDAIAAKEMLKGLENMVGDEPIKRIAVFKEIESLRELSDQYRGMLNDGVRLVDERMAFNKRVAAQTQRSRYQDMTFRVTRNYALESYRSYFDLAARYVYLAAKAYDYETNLDPSDPGSSRGMLAAIVRQRNLGRLGLMLRDLKANYDTLRGQLGVLDPQVETGKISLRTELFRILPSGSSQPTNGSSQFPDPGAQSDQLWRNKLEAARVADLWMLPEYRYYCRPFSSESDGSGQHVAEPGIILRFSTRVMAGQNFFGNPLSGADHAYDPSHYATKIRSVGVWFSDYLSESVLDDLPATPRVYLIPVGLDVMSIPTSDDPSLVRLWKVVDQRVPVPVPATSAVLDDKNWIPLLDGLNGRMGEPRKFSMFRAYHDGGSEVNEDELVFDSRLIGRSIWNTQWLLIIPGRVLNEDPGEGLDRFIEQVSDIRLVFQTYGYSGG